MRADTEPGTTYGPTSDHRLPDPEVTDLIGVVYRRRWWILLVMVVAAAAGYALGSQSPRENQAETRLLLVGSEQGVSAPVEPLPLEERQSAVVSRAESRPVEAEATEALDLAPGDIKSISAESPEAESVVTITVTTKHGLDTAAITDRVATSVIAQQRNAVRERSAALAEELRGSAAAIDGDIAAVDGEVAQLVQEAGSLQAQVDANPGTVAGAEAQARLTVTSETIAGLHSSRASLVTTQSDFDRRAREADVSAAASSGGVELESPAGDVSSAHTFPPGQLAVILASIGLVAMVCASYFTAYRAEATQRYPVLVMDPDSNGGVAGPPEGPSGEGPSRRDDGAQRAERA
ncbi:MAG TPA: hypothetical protein VFY82_11165 [Acidimicrobiales bacterium]|nr:hypothetical protein [Acidimicrobiales bacterium]